MSAPRRDCSSTATGAYAEVLERLRHVLDNHWRAYLDTPGRAQLQAVLSAAESLPPEVRSLAEGRAGRAADAFAQETRRALASERAPAPEMLDALNRHMRDLLASLRPWVRLDGPSCRLLPSPLRAITNNRRVYLLTGDPAIARELPAQIKAYGYDMRAFTSPPQLFAAVEESPPAAFVAECSFLGDSPCEFALAVAEAHEDSASAPILLLTKRDDMTSRLAAVRAGASGFFVAPVGADDLADALDDLLKPLDAEPSSVLVVDDDPSSALARAAVLTERGWTARVLSEPLRIFTPLAERRPDLILMDMYMRGVSGLELARVVRQRRELLGLPIVLLASEAGLDARLMAAGCGVDDLLPKDVSPARLIAVIESRIQRARALRALMDRDGLTGLYNHTAMKLRLAQELARAERSGSRLAFAMIDLDRFKLVNDTYGHPVGDRVLMALARVLKQRLRRSDVLGRYGGEEFAVILPGAGPDDAVKILDEMREAFAAVRHIGGESAFQVSFSVGVACWPHPNAAGPVSHTDLTDAADKALYEAKRAGRNCVRLAS